ncbi:MAG TPA: DUF4296 domain-containing protein [Pedobacter sp.]|uniref:DUF4296 domain-containing protein n=1 Tax=Pedobacter sp. TaxID=1411316 RepID=UPI002CDBBA66|nr:DUF4296 domain-containing protein [Pedobacter sp.]HMI01468.1 DUF4296 domain-containing protein [Pedobacter sp.]
MKNFIYIVISFLLMTGCKPGIPKDLIQPDEMALILHDIHVFDGYINAVANMDTARVVAAGYYKGIYKKFGIDSALYSRSFAYYNKHPKAMTEIYTKVVSRLDKEKKAFVRADSLATAKILNTQKARMKADSLKLKNDSIKRSDSLKIAKEKKKFLRQMDSLKKLSLSPKERLKSITMMKKLSDSLKMVKKKDSLRKAKRMKKTTKINTVKKVNSVK